eukprot:CAMPEP_0202908852 /NCGR_PEP_ID=MMETSP1392-20130828/47406_1 /ASSEMBLY_ACC=CAM_ASM_000868 /TAXON_ID=225041 /ORGANISM="Chlamydomonas chlamydogama, Strain SAG 11-48b" /LENGTH=391 /DNA_ID=CAMNT_0049598367 /DNA_START=295 /DNA_END=1470 /DNA_ORIENTATION=+
MMLGAAALHIDTPVKIDALRKKLRGLSLIDTLIADDALVPCLMLPAPQVQGLPLRDRSALQTAISKVAAAAQTEYCALLGEGCYLSATPEWWLLQPKEILLLQHIATHAPETADIDMGVYLSVKKYHTPLRLLCLTLDQGVHLLLLCRGELDQGVLHAVIEEHSKQVEHIFQIPVWCMPPLPQFHGITFDLALLVQKQPVPCITLFWGHSSVALPGFNPLVSPTLRRQLQSSAGGSVGSGPSMRSVSFTREAAATDNLQLYYKSCVDMLVSFMLQQQQHSSAGRAAEGHFASRSTDSACVAQGPPQMVHSPTKRMLPSFTFASRHAQAAVQAGGEEVHLLTGGNRLIGLLDSSTHGCDVYAVFNKKTARLDALENAQKLRAVFQMTYAETV